MTEEVWQIFSWKRQAYLFCFELIPAKWKRTMRSLKMPPFCRNLVTSEMLSFPFLCACKISRALEACAFTLRLYSLCRVFCLNSPGSCAFKWVERLGGNRILARARHVHGKGVIYQWSDEVVETPCRSNRDLGVLIMYSDREASIDLICGKFIHRARTCETMFESSENLSTDSDLRTTLFRGVYPNMWISHFLLSKFDDQGD